MLKYSEKEILFCVGLEGIFNILYSLDESYQNKLLIETTDAEDIERKFRLYYHIDSIPYYDSIKHTALVKLLLDV